MATAYETQQYLKKKRIAEFQKKQREKYGDEKWEAMLAEAEAKKKYDSPAEKAIRAKAAREEEKRVKEEAHKEALAKLTPEEREARDQKEAASKKYQEDYHKRIAEKAAKEKADKAVKRKKVSSTQSIGMRYDLMGWGWDEENSKWIPAGPDDTPEEKAARVMVHGKDGKLFLPTAEERAELYEHWDKIISEGKQGTRPKTDPEYKMAVRALGARGLSAAFIPGAGIDSRMFINDKDNATYKNLKEGTLTPAEHLADLEKQSTGSSVEKVKGSGEVGDAAYGDETKEKYGGLTWEEYVAKARDKKAGGEYDAKEQRREPPLSLASLLHEQP